MNMQRSTASESRLPDAALSARSLEIGLAEGAYVAFLLLVFVGLSPFSPRDAAALNAVPDTGAGDALRQLGYLGVFGAIAGLAFLQRGLRAFAATPLLFLALLAWCMASALWAGEPDVTFRRAVLVAIVVLSAFLSVDTIGAERALKLWWIVLVGILIVNWVTSPILPQAVHLPGDPEPSVVGNWRGMYFHKNIAGSIAATSTIVFLYYALTLRRWRDIALCLASVGYLVMTVSKSSMGLLPAALFLAAAYRLSIGRGRERAAALIAALLLLIVAATAVALVWDQILFFLADPRTFTGRTAIWQAEIAYIGDHSWLGSGFGSFADTGNRSPMYNYMGAAWVGTMAQGHHGYLELLVTIGGVGFTLAMITLIVQPLFAFWRNDNVDPTFKTLLFALFAFVVLHNFMESDFLVRDGPEWVSFLLVLAMLRTAARENAVRR